MGTVVISEQPVRRRVGRPPIPTARIIAAALAVVDEGGAEALSMRAVAAQLGSSTATLYRHFPDRGSLTDAMIDHVIGEIDLEAEEIRSGGWKAGCRKIATDYFEALGRHRGVALVLADRTPVGPNGTKVRECWLALMLGAGFPVDIAVKSGATMSTFVQGYAIQYAGQRASEGLDDERIPALLATLDPADFPAIALTLASETAVPVSVEDEFTFALEMMLDGIGRLQPG